MFAFLLYSASMRCFNERVCLFNCLKARAFLRRQRNLIFSSQLLHTAKKKAQKCWKRAIFYYFIIFFALSSFIRVRFDVSRNGLLIQLLKSAIFLENATYLDFFFTIIEVSHLVWKWNGWDDGFFRFKFCSVFACLDVPLIKKKTWPPSDRLSSIWKLCLVFMASEIIQNEGSVIITT